MLLGATKNNSLPIVSLKGQAISDPYLKKFPRDFIAKYRLVSFGMNEKGEYQIACEQPDSPLTKQILDFIVKKNQVKVELFQTTKDDLDYALGLYDNQDAGATEVSQSKEGVDSVKTEDEDTTDATSPNTNGKKPQIASFLETFFSKDQQGGLTVDKQPKLEVFQNRNTTNEATESNEPEKAADVSQANSPKAEVSDQIVNDVSAGPTREQVPAAGQNDKVESGEQSSGEVVSAPNDPSKPSVNATGNSGEGKKPEKNLEEKDLGIILGDEGVKELAKLQKIVSEGYIPKAVAAIVSYAINSRASDIHIEPGTRQLRVRCRIDGVLRDAVHMPISLHAPVISRIKILSRLKIDESRVPQDGRFELVSQGREVDIRVSVLPTVNGEKAVLRVLDKEQSTLSLEDLGMQGTAFDLTVDSISKPYGIILSTGPTGSGKSTTLYSILSRLSVPGVNIVTLEDPVEYEIPGVSQCQVKPEIGFTFASGLRSVLRQDPNVIMVGEIRDAETAAMATHAALTGHLVLSTLHTNDTAGALPRLINMGVEPFLITSSINLVIAQRLVRRICVKCREEMKVPAKVMEDIKSELSAVPQANKRDVERIPKDLRLYYGRGCSECNQGFRGRIGIFEVMEINPEIEELAVNKRPANEIKEVSLRGGMITMKQDGVIKALNGLTTIDEVMQATIT